MKALMSMVRMIMILLCVFSHSSVGTRVEPADDRQDHDNDSRSSIQSPSHFTSISPTSTDVTGSHLLSSLTTHKRNYANRAQRRHRKRNSRRQNKAVTGGQGAMTSRSCCNGRGLCVLGTLCHCKKRYYGRYCELEYTTRDCGPVRDGAVFSHRCKLCRCIDGTLACSREATPECTDVEVQPIFHQFYPSLRPKPTPGAVHVTAPTQRYSDIDDVDAEIRDIFHDYEAADDSSGADGHAVITSSLYIFVWLQVVYVL